MGKLFLVSITFILAAVSLPVVIYAQKDLIPKGGFSSPLDPEVDVRPLYLGGIIGFGPSNQSGEF
ncbi:MAG: hypothetical protein IPM69_04835 [Ignavibacteria bacterium]|nr:hypothetical protein [Ignavibacteria bacterium]